MRNKLGFIFLASAALAACGHTPNDQPSQGVSSLNEPVVSRTDHTIDLAAPDGSLAAGEASRLDAWLRSLAVDYGDSVHVEGPHGEARGQVAAIAGRYGLFLSQGAPVTVGAVAPGAVRVIVSRTRVGVYGCPNWSESAVPNYQNRTLPNFGCAVNANIAAMAADPRDLIQGRAGSAIADAATAAKAIDMYRTWPHTALRIGQDERPLLTVNTRIVEDK